MGHHCERPNHMAFRRNAEGFAALDWKAAEECKQRLVGHPGRSLKDSNAETECLWELLKLDSINFVLCGHSKLWPGSRMMV